MAEVRIDLKSSFISDGADSVKNDIDGLSDSLRNLAREQKEVATGVFPSPQNVDSYPRVNDGSQVREMPPVGGYYPHPIIRNPDIVDGTTDPREAAREMLREMGIGNVETEAFDPEQNTPHRNSIYRRLQGSMSTFEANMSVGRMGVADRSLGLAENYLEQLRAIEGNTLTVRQLSELLEAHRTSIDNLRRSQDETNNTLNNPPQLPPSGGNGGGDPGGGGGLGGLPILNGNPLSMGGLFRSAMGMLGPWGIAGLGIAGTVATAKGLEGWLDRKQDPFLQEADAFLDLGREMGTERSVYRDFADENYNAVPELDRLRYSTAQAGQFAAAYGMPRNMLDGISGANDQTALFEVAIAGLGLSRAIGADTTQVAGLMRQGTQTGALGMGVNDASQFASVMYQAVRDGTDAGVSQAERFKSMEQYLGSLASRGLSGSVEGLAAYSSMIRSLEQTGNRALMGENAGQAIGGLVDGLANSGDPYTKFMALNAMGFGGGNAPDAAALGLEGSLATRYNELLQTNPTMAGEFALEQAQAMNPGALRPLLSGLDKTFGNNRDLAIQFLKNTGNWSMEQILQMQGDFGGAGFGFAEGALMPENLEKYTSAQVEDSQAGVIADTFEGQSADRYKYMQTLEAQIGITQGATAALSDLNTKIKELELNASEQVGGTVEGVSDIVGPSVGSPTDIPFILMRLLNKMGTGRGSSADFIDRLMPVVQANESSGNYGTVVDVTTGEPGRQALGAFGVLSTNFEGPGGWDKDALGQDITKQQFLENPAFQDAIVKDRLERYSQQLDEFNPQMGEDERVRRIAAAWLGGPDELEKDFSQMNDRDQFGTSTGGYGMKWLEDYRKMYPQQNPLAPQKKEPEGSVNGGQTVTVRFEGSSGVTVLGGGQAGANLQVNMNTALGQFARESAGSINTQRG
jgi:hypothetical protein